MPPLAQAALAASIVLSALGAVVICLLTAVYGFTPPSEESPRQTTRRLFLTRVGHAVAASCFAATAILLAIVLAQPRPSAPAPGGDARVPGLASKLDAQIQRLEGVERRMKDSEQTLQRLEMEVSDVATQRPASTPVAAPEKPRASLAPKPAEPSRATAAAKPPAASRPGGAPPRPSEILPAPPPKSPTTAAPSASKPADVTASTAKPAEVAPPPPRPVESGPGTGPSADRPAGDEPAASPVSRPSATPRTRDTPPPPRDFPSKLREDWRAIRKAWDNAGDDFRAAIDRLRNGGN